MRKGNKVRRDDDTKGWYLTLTKLELKEIRAKHWKPVVVGEIGESAEESISVGINKEEPNKTDTDVITECRMTKIEEKLGTMEDKMTNRMTKVENKLEKMETILDRIEQVLSKIEK